MNSKDRIVLGLFWPLAVVAKTSPARRFVGMWQQLRSCGVKPPFRLRQESMDCGFSNLFLTLVSFSLS